MHLRIYSAIFILLAFCNHASAQLSARTSQEIQLLINEKNSRTPSQQKMDSRLLQFVKEQRGQKMVAGVNLEVVKMDADSKGYLKVDIRADVNDNLLSRIEGLGGKIIFSSALFHSITAEITPVMAEKIAAFQEIKFVAPATTPVLEGGHTNLPNTVKPVTNIVRSKASFQTRTRRVTALIQDYLKKAEKSNTMFSGSVNSQGDKAHRTEETRNAYGYAGQGIRIGVMSDSYNALGTAAADVASGNLPGPGNPFGNTTPVTVLQDLVGGTDEGRAMMQILHDLAPKAQLFFATAYNSPANFATNIINLRNAPYNCDIIIDDIFYYNEPVFYDGIIAQAVNTVTANGALYFSSAGNAGSISKNTAGAYEADFNDAGSPAFTFPGGTKSGTIHNFGTVTLPINGDSIAASGAYYNLHWADPTAASTNDYDLFVVSSAGAVKASSTNVQNGTQDPYEEITAPTLVAGDKLVIFKTAAAAVRAFQLNTNRGRLKYATVGQTHGHSSAADAYSVAATPAATAYTSGTQAGPFPAAFNTANKVETFSSDGPRRIFFNANGTPITPGNFLFGTNGGVVRNKPDITAADGVSTTVAALNPFYGTSAAAPHAGAIAGLLKSANRSLTSAQIRTILTSTTVDVEGPGYDNLSGYGILQAFQAMQLLSPTPQAAILPGTVTATEGSFSNNSGVVDPGELANLKIQLTNPSMVDATNVSGVITTTTPGITITQNSSAYGTVSAGGNAVNITNFVFAVNSTVQCGSTINLYITVSLSGGVSPLVFLVPVTIGSQPFTGISAVLGGTPSSGAGYTVTSGQQTGRIFRAATASSCATPLANPGLTLTTGSRQYDAYTFTNTNAVSQCVTVTLTSTNGTNLYTSAYSDSGFVPSNPALHYLAEPGPSGLTQVYSFNVDAGKAFTVVVHDVNVTPASNSAYNLSLSLANCNVGPACSQINITSDTIATGATGVPYNQAFAATGGSSNYSFTYTGSLPAGLSFSGNTITGTPTQAGTFPIKIIANDLTGCPPDTNSYLLVITGLVPASLSVVSGSPQTVLPGSDFPDSLKVIVRDSLHNPLPGVKVVFNAPSSGQGGTFTGGVKTISIVSNAGGISSAKFTANAITGTYIVTASVVGLPDTVFNLTNFCPTSFVVTSNADSGPGTLRDIINNGCAGIPITFDPSVTSIILTSGEIAITKAVTITGPGASKLTISGNNNSRIFNIVAGAAAVSISGMTIRDGKPTAASSNGGGAILINNGVAAGIVNIYECVITSNNTTLTTYPAGGAIDNEGGNVTIDRSSITNNTASFRAGAIMHQLYGSMVITNSTIAGNTAGPAGIGGAIRSLLPLSISNSTIYGNSALTGGNISRAADTVRINNTIIAGGSLIGTTGTGPDLNGGAFKSGDYNLIQNLTASGTINGITTHNITGVSPLLLPLANNGGESPTLLPLPTSPVVNSGDTAITITTDQRKFARVIGGRADIGAVEANYTLIRTAGTPQTTAILKPFSQPLQASVTESSNSIGGVSVMFTAPTTGASGSFANGTARDTVVTNFLGIANSHTFIANNLVGTYFDTASIGSIFSNSTYSLTNAIALPLSFGAVTASASNCTTNITWKTLAEIDTKEFSVEYSEDGVNYISVATLPAKGTSTSAQEYTYGHVSTQEGIHYYRIKQTDINGHFSYSNMLIVTNKCGKQPVVVYPNPVEKNITVVIPGLDVHTITVFDAVGQKIHQQVVHGGTYEINASNWVKGVYTLSVSMKGEAAFVVKLLKE